MKILIFLFAVLLVIFGFVIKSDAAIKNDIDKYDTAIFIYEYTDDYGIHTGYKIGKGQLLINDIDPFIERVKDCLKESINKNNIRKI